jgi:hypothetical protein
MFVQHKELVEFFKLRVCGVCLSLNQISAAIECGNLSIRCLFSLRMNNSHAKFYQFFRPQKDLKQGYSRNLGLALNSCLRCGALIPRTALILVLTLHFCFCYRTRVNEMCLMGQ